MSSISSEEKQRGENRGEETARGKRQKREMQGMAGPFSRRGCLGVMMAAESAETGESQI